MTNEEAIKILKIELEPVDPLFSEVQQALDMAIEALSKPTCEKYTELISKEDAINELDEFIKPFVGLVGDMGAAINGAREVIKDVSPVEVIPCEVADKIGEENERLKDTIGQLEEQTQWIPCSERLPRTGDDILVTFSNGEVDIIINARPKAWAKYEKANNLIFPIAWMPLQKRYREDDEE